MVYIMVYISRACCDSTRCIETRDKAHTREASVLCKFCDTRKDTRATPAKFSHLIRTTSYRIITCRTWLLQECTPNAFCTGTRTVIQSVPLQRTALRPCITVRPPKCAAILGGNGRQSDAWAKP